MLHRAVCARVSVLVLVILGILITPAVSRAFVTGPKWLNKAWVYMRVNPNLDLLLRNNTGNFYVPGAGDATSRAKEAWNNYTGFYFYQDIWQNTSGEAWPISARETAIQGTGPCTSEATAIALTCVGAVGGRRGYAYEWTQTDFNTTFRFTTSGQPGAYDVWSVAQHELGHWMFLGDLGGIEAHIMGSGNVMSEDDKRGVTQQYGPYTGFDAGRPAGVEYTFNNDYFTYDYYEAYWARVRGWQGYGFNPTYPELGVRSRECVNGVCIPVYYSDNYKMMAGNATSNLSYVYFKLFSWLDDQRGDNQNFSGTTNDIIKGAATIPTGARLKWCQYNHQQYTMSIDAVFTDGTALRDDDRIKDQYNHRIHPAYRPAHLGRWECYDVDLSLANGKKVANWYIAYDNRITGTGGNFRAYFDSFKLVWPDGPKP
jgi:hypothetical protein